MTSTLLPRRLRILALLAGVAAVPLRVDAQPPAAPEPIRYTISFPAPQTNYFDVEARVPTGGRPSIELMMAVWTPGSYLIREYERNVEGVTASAAGHAVPVEKTIKNRWRVATGSAREVTVTYRLYAHEMTVRSNWVEADFAMLNGAPTFLTLVETGSRPHDVRLQLPSAWRTSVTGMPAAPDGQPNHYLAADYDALVDSPIVAGNPTIHQFTVAGTPHFLVDVGEGGVFDGARAARDLASVVAAAGRIWGSLPYDKYVFFNVLAGSGGGAIEHRNSVMMMGSPWATTTRSNYVGWLSTAAHEHFHLWNVKRLRPIELGPFDYEHEVYPRSLWISEGVTDYYADLVLRRAGLIDQDEYLWSLSNAIRSLQTTPGRQVQTVEMSSFDAWIKGYRPDANSVNSSISYYTKGSVLGFLLDAAVRSATAGAKSLDDVMRTAFARYSGPQGFTPEQFRQVASDIAGRDLSAWFHRALETTEELDYTPALDWFGLEFQTHPNRRRVLLGARTRNENGRLIVTEVQRGTPGYEAGLNPDDEIVAIDDFRVPVDQFDARLDMYRAGQRVSLLIARHQQLKRLDVTLAAAPSDRWTLDVRPDASSAQLAHLEVWLK